MVRYLGNRAQEPTARYSLAGEFAYDHPFLWGSKRTGPDLHREGGKYPDSWHYLHMRQPASTSPGSIMPAYTWLYDQVLDTSHIEGKIITLRRLGVPYPAGYENPVLFELGKPRVSAVRRDMAAQAGRVAAGLTQAGLSTPADREIIALIAYLQRLGTDIKAAPPVDTTTAAVAAPAAGGTN